MISSLLAKFGPLIGALKRWGSVALVGGLLVSCAHRPSSAWPEWDSFSDRFMSSEGRIVDLTFDGKTTSEGQSYAMFFALVANQRNDFERLLQWTDHQLADGQLGSKLPAWHWGKNAQGVWGVRDRNSATDSDLWIAYTLLEAGRIWAEPRYHDMGVRMLRRIAEASVVDAGVAGPVLLPGPYGFSFEGTRYRINPSYLPGFMFTYFARLDPAGPWADIWSGFVRQAEKFAPQGIAPNWYMVRQDGEIQADTEASPIGSYDAIRTYLWAGMSGPDSQVLLTRLAHYAELTRSLGRPPEKVDPLTGQAEPGDFSPSGFSGAMLPFLSALGDRNSLEQQEQRLRQQRLVAKIKGNANYYDEALILFGLGWIDGYYWFDAQGRLELRWKEKPLP